MLTEEHALPRHPTIIIMSTISKCSKMIINCDTIRRILYSIGYGNEYISIYKCMALSIILIRCFCCILLKIQYTNHTETLYNHIQLAICNISTILYTKTSIKFSNV